ncbi:MAG: LysM peptidoglycan-binding domain-containing protein [Desulfocapsa sp.]|nr:LysM peptidoglycan-binding domain-containing protein [Desulfocapsa sp.]
MDFVCCFLLLLFCVFITPKTLFAANPFPRYIVIEDNVRFWEDIYGRYSTSQAVIHDSDNLGIIYEIVPIVNHRMVGASKINQPILKGVKRKYSKILRQLAKGAPPRNNDEKRVAALFGKAGPKRLQKAADSVRVQIGQKNRFLEGVILSGSYMAEIKRIFQQEGLPQDLAYLPHVESSFNMRAYSKFGASGIWQFTRATGKQFLTIDYVVDERQDPILASHAAAKFLKNNHKLLGSWPLALTAYNYGPAGMLRAKKAHSNYENIFRHYEQGHFKFASRNFYSEFLAAVKVAKKLEKSFSVLLDKPEKTLHFTLPAYVGVEDLCRHFDISTKIIKKLNPAIREPVLQGKKYLPKGFVLHLPYSARHKKLLAGIPKHIYHKKQKPTKFYRVRPGDTAGEIAQANGIPLKALRQANNLSKTAIILVGQNLRIPDNGRPHQLPPATLAATDKKKMIPSPNARLSKESLPLLADSKKNKPAWKNIQKSRSIVLGEIGIREISKKQNVAQGTIIIQPEESLELLAGWLKVTPATLRKLNNLPTNGLIHPDEELRIDLSRVSAQKFEEKRFDFHLETEEDFFNTYKVVGVQTYTVKKGDTVWELCRTKFDLPFWLLKKYNIQLNFSGLRSSQQLTIPIVKTI